MRFVLAVLVVLSMQQLSFAEAHDQCATTQSVTDVQLSLALKDGRTIFHAGEIIPLLLSFTSTAKGRYWASNRSYDRSGRLEIDSYCLEPHAADPLESYFKFGIFELGGLSSEKALDAIPFTVEAELNEWRAPVPGHYRLYVVSNRVSRAADARDKTNYQYLGIALRSNVVEFDVKPADTAWEHEQAQKALETLTSVGMPNASAQAAFPQTTRDDQRHAARVLRFLRTKEAAEQMARLFWGLNDEQPAGWDLMLGLYGSPYRHAAIDAMHAEIPAPGHAITVDFLRTIVGLEIGADRSWDPPVYDPAHPEISSEFWKRRQAHHIDLMKAETATTIANVSRKAGVAHALTLNGAMIASGGDPQIVRRIRPALIATWDHLPRQTQNEIIQYRWDLVAGPDMIPLLKRTIAQPPPIPRTEDASARDASLEHLMELDRVEGLAAIRQELQNPAAQPNIAVVGLLPRADVMANLPAAVQRIIHGKARELDFELLDHYGEESTLKDIQQIFEAKVGEWACAPQTSMLRYFLRVVPEYGAREVAASLEARKYTGCFRYQFQDLRDALPLAQKSAIAALDDPDPDVVQDAVIALTHWGTAEAEPALWKRMERFHADWSGKEDELRMTPDYKSAGARGAALEQGLVNAIAQGAGWICPPEKLKQLGKLALTRQQRMQIENWAKLWGQKTVLITPTYFPENAPTFSVLQYNQLSKSQMKEKIGQLPRGMQLSWEFWQPGQIAPPISMARQEAVYEAMKSVAEQHGIELGKTNFDGK